MRSASAMSFERPLRASRISVALADSIPEPLGADLPEFTAHYQRYVARWRVEPKDFQIRPGSTSDPFGKRATAFVAKNPGKAPPGLGR